MPLRPTIALAAALVAIPASSAHASMPIANPFDAPRANAAFERAGWVWPTRRITYHVAARADAGAVRAAVRKWNRSGVRLRFVQVPRRRARVVIRYWPQTGCVPGGVTGTSYDQSTGRPVRAEVRISRPYPTNVACSRWAITMVVAHELGHVLGLAHETRRCALMNPTLVTLSPERCIPPLEPWRWRCRVLERDDVRGAVRLYGGRVKRRGRATCDLFAPPATPPSLTAAPDGFGGLVASFARPPAHRPPAHVLAGPESYLVAYRLNSCPGSPGEAGSITTAGLWTVPEGGIQQVRCSRRAPGAGASPSGAATAWAGSARSRRPPSRTSRSPRTTTRPPGSGRVAGGRSVDRAMRAKAPARARG